MPAKETEGVPLCYRCESRAAFHETGARPRFECGTEGAVHGCYMYRPVIPLALRSNRGDRRPLFAGTMISGRAVGVKMPRDFWKANGLKVTAPDRRKAVVCWVHPRKLEKGNV